MVVWKFPDPDREFEIALSDPDMIGPTNKLADCFERL